ncbi:MAG: hypothetical protein RLZZ546_2566 [Bacteroidota bacterium]|jgi:DNA polymerase III delta subunit
MENKKTKSRSPRKNVKISEDTHTILIEYCNKNLLNMRKFLDKLIKENCKID